MSTQKQLIKRSNNSCEMCQNTELLAVYQVPDVKDNGLDTQLHACNTCITQFNDATQIQANHWHCLNDTIWSEHNAVKIMAWRMLHRIQADWTTDLRNMMYLDDALLELAKASGDGEPDENAIIHRDVNGVTLQNGDAVVLIKDLKVKGSSLVAKQGTAVRNIRLDRNNAEYIEGKVGAQNIVIITKYVKKL